MNIVPLNSVNRECVWQLALRRANNTEHKPGQNNSFGLVSAIRNGTPIGPILKSGIEVNFTVDRDGNSLLHFAIAHDREVKLINQLITSGIPVDTQNRLGQAPLHIAVGRSKKVLVKNLLLKGAKVNIADKKGRTPLHLAANSGNLPIVEMLTTEEAVDVNARDKDGVTPLLFATRSRSPDLAVIEQLVSKDADISLGDSKGVTPLLAAIKSRNSKVANYLIKRGANINAADNNGVTPLIAAIIEKNTPVALNLIRRGADVNAADNYKVAPLIAAIEANYCDSVAEELINKGANIRVLDRGRNTPLHIAAGLGKLSITELLIGKRAELNVLNERGESPLFCAISNSENCLELMRLLIQSGANVDGVSSSVQQQQEPQEEFDRSAKPLSECFRSGNFEAAELLLENGAKPNYLTNGFGNDIYTDPSGMAELLINKIKVDEKYNGEPILVEAIRNNLDSRFIKTLVERGADIDDSDRNGYTVLHYAAMRSRYDIFQYLIERGVDPNKTNERGETPFEILLSSSIPNRQKSFLDFLNNVYNL